MHELRDRRFWQGFIPSAQERTIFHPPLSTFPPYKSLGQKFMHQNECLLLLLFPSFSHFPAFLNMQQLASCEHLSGCSYENERYPDQFLTG